jgi:phosphoribosylaminoimidazole-succinocarboxamide synthase
MIYLLDGKMELHAADDEAVVLASSSGDDSNRFELQAVGGNKVEFDSKDQDLLKMIDAEGAEARLRVTIQGTRYSGTVAHDHDH